MLDLYGTLLTVFGVVCALVYVRGFDPSRVLADGWGNTATVGYAAVCLAIAAFCFQSAGAIWGRFNFESDLVWVELLGTWQSSRIGTGNQLNSRLQTENDVVRVEAMTLRIWRARVESVVFGKDGQRQVTAMYATSQEAARLADDLEAFAAPPERVRRAARGRGPASHRRAAGHRGAAGRPAPARARGRARGRARRAARDVRARSRADWASGHGARSSARFCTACGTRAAARREVLQRLRHRAAGGLIAARVPCSTQQRRRRGWTTSVRHHRRRQLVDLRRVLVADQPAQERDQQRQHDAHGDACPSPARPNSFE